MKAITLDLETDGKYKIIQIAYFISEDNKIIKQKNHFLNDGTDTVDYYKKITVEFIREHGIKPQIVLKEVAEDLQICDTIIGHNINFDISKLKNYFYKYKIKYQIPTNIFDTMHKSKNLLNLKNKNGNLKFPSLKELCKFFCVNYDDTDAHDGLYDVDVTYQCYCKLNNNKLINSFIELKKLETEIEQVKDKRIQQKKERLSLLNTFEIGRSKNDFININDKQYLKIKKQMFIDFDQKINVYLYNAVTKMTTFYNIINYVNNNYKQYNIQLDLYVQLGDSLVTVETQVKNINEDIILGENLQKLYDTDIYVSFFRILELSSI